MKINTRTRYGMRAMIDLAMHYEKGPVLLKDISRRQDVSMKYLDRIISELKRAGLIAGEGKGTGYRLSRKPEKIRAGEVFEVLEGRYSVLDCVLNENSCDRVSRCSSRLLWKNLSSAVKNSLSVSLKELALREKKMIQQSGRVYHI